MLQTVFDRPLYLNRLKKYQNSEFIKVIIGVRRSGKTFVLKMFRRHLQQSGVAEAQIVFLNFESMQYQPLHTAETQYRHVMERAVAGQKTYLFFDEIQRMAGWEDAVNSLRVDLDADIYLTDSNSSLLSGELATLLVGCMVEIPVFPLLFQEYIQFRCFDGVPDMLFPELRATRRLSRHGVGGRRRSAPHHFGRHLQFYFAQRSERTDKPARRRRIKPPRHLFIERNRQQHFH